MAGVDVTVEKSAGMNVAGVDPAEAEEAGVYVVAVELAGKNVVGVDEMAMDEQVCGVEL